MAAAEAGGGWGGMPPSHAAVDAPTAADSLDPDRPTYVQSNSAPPIEFRSPRYSRWRLRHSLDGRLVRSRPFTDGVRSPRPPTSDPRSPNWSPSQDAAPDSPWASQERDMGLDNQYSNDTPAMGRAVKSHAHESEYSPRSTLEPEERNEELADACPAPEMRASDGGSSQAHSLHLKVERLEAELEESSHREAQLMTRITELEAIITKTGLTQADGPDLPGEGGSGASGGASAEKSEVGAMYPSRDEAAVEAESNGTSAVDNVGDEPGKDGERAAERGGNIPTGSKEHSVMFAAVDGSGVELGSSVSEGAADMVGPEHEHGRKEGRGRDGGEGEPDSRSPSREDVHVLPSKEGSLHRNTTNASLPVGRSLPPLEDPPHARATSPAVADDQASLLSDSPPLTRPMLPSLGALHATFRLPPTSSEVHVTLESLHRAHCLLLEYATVLHSYLPALKTLLSIDLKEPGQWIEAGANEDAAAAVVLLLRRHKTALRRRLLGCPSSFNTPEPAPEPKPQLTGPLPPLGRSMMPTFRRSVPALRPHSATVVDTLASKDVQSLSQLSAALSLTSIDAVSALSEEAVRFDEALEHLRTAHEMLILQAEALLSYAPRGCHWPDLDPWRWRASAYSPTNPAAVLRLLRSHQTRLHSRMTALSTRKYDSQQGLGGSLPNDMQPPSNEAEQCGAEDVLSKAPSNAEAECPAQPSSAVIGCGYQGNDVLGTDVSGLENGGTAVADSGAKRHDNRDENAEEGKGGKGVGQPLASDLASGGQVLEPELARDGARLAEGRSGGVSLKESDGEGEGESGTGRDAGAANVGEGPTPAGMTENEGSREDAEKGGFSEERQGHVDGATPPGESILPESEGATIAGFVETVSECPIDEGNISEGGDKGDSSTGENFGTTDDRVAEGMDHEASVEDGGGTPLGKNNSLPGASENGGDEIASTKQESADVNRAAADRLLSGDEDTGMAGVGGGGLLDGESRQSQIEKGGEVENVAADNDGNDGSDEEEKEENEDGGIVMQGFETEKEGEEEEKNDVGQDSLNCEEPREGEREAEEVIAHGLRDRQEGNVDGEEENLKGPKFCEGDEEQQNGQGLLHCEEAEVGKEEGGRRSPLIQEQAEDEQVDMAEEQDRKILVDGEGVDEDEMGEDAATSGINTRHPSDPSKDDGETLVLEASGSAVGRSIDDDESSTGNSGSHDLKTGAPQRFSPPVSRENSEGEDGEGVSETGKRYEVQDGDLPYNTSEEKVILRETRENPEGRPEDAPAETKVPSQHSSSSHSDGAAAESQVASEAEDPEDSGMHDDEVPPPGAMPTSDTVQIGRKEGGETYDSSSLDMSASEMAGEETTIEE